MSEAAVASFSTPACIEPDRDCPLCPRLAEFRQANRVLFPDKFNAPVPGFGPVPAPLLVVGLAPGLRGANFSGRPFTGDYAGDLLYATLLKFGLAEGTYRADPQDGLRLVGARIANAVRCVPPQNKPTPQEIATCNGFLRAELDCHGSALRSIFALGQIAHNAVLRAHGLVAARYRFGHGAVHELPGGVRLVDSYHCSRYNTNTGRLTAQMFEEALQKALP